MSRYYAVAYVDGSYNFEVCAYSCGVVYYDKRGKRTISGRGKDSHLIRLRNVTGELKSSAVAIETAIRDGKDILYIHYDYEGIEKWATNKWKAKHEGAIMYQQYFNSIKGDLDVKFIKVKSKSGNVHHNEADKLATWAMG